MLEQAFLYEQASDLVSRTRQAADAYARLAEQHDDPLLREQLGRLHRDKLRHVQLAERLREILE